MSDHPLKRGPEAVDQRQRRTVFWSSLGAIGVLLTIAGVVATIWWPLEARLFGYELALGGYDRAVSSGYYNFGNGGALILNAQGTILRFYWSRASGPEGAWIKFASPYE